MPTASSWADPLRDVGHLVAFRASTLRHPRAARAGVVAVVGLTLAAAVVPALLPGSGVHGPGAARDALLLLPSAFAGLVLLQVVTAVASGGGRELIDRDAASVHPLSPTTDHLGALLLAPLNVAWMIQAWTLLGAVSYGLATSPWRVLAGEVGAVLWLVCATATGQVVGWAVEAVRRTDHGVAAVRTVAVAGGLGALVLQLSGRFGSALDALPTRYVVSWLVRGFTLSWGLTLAGLALGAVALVVLGAWPARFAARRPPREELRLESGTHPARSTPATVLGLLVRLDRGSVWRSVPIRRGAAVLGVMPGVVALLGALPWHALVVMPGLVASGGALLFGVNAWCLEGRGALWRASLPVEPRLVFWARAWVLGELLLVGSVVTVLVGGLRSGLPSPSEATALVAGLLVVTVQVVSASMRWSGRTPYAVDLRSARATPAPPLGMVGYSVRLAVVTTLTGLVFSGLARLPSPWLPLLVALPFLCFSLARLVVSADTWADPVERARVVMTVSG